MPKSTHIFTWSARSKQRDATTPAASVTQTPRGPAGTPLALVPTAEPDPQDRLALSDVPDTPAAVATHGPLDMRNPRVANAVAATQAWRDNRCTQFGARTLVDVAHTARTIAASLELVKGNLRLDPAGAAEDAFTIALGEDLHSNFTRLLQGSPPPPRATLARDEAPPSAASHAAGLARRGPACGTPSFQGHPFDR